MICISEKTIIRFLSDYTDYLKTRDNNVRTIFLDYEEGAKAEQAGAWYNHQPITGEHRIFYNLYNLHALLIYLKNGDIDINQFFAILVLFVGHEYRHFEQGRCIWDSKSIEGFSQQDAFETQLVVYIMTFFDTYYSRNKGYLRFEEDAELFAIINGLDFMKKHFPNINPEEAMLEAANFLGSLHGKKVVDFQTMPYHSDSIDGLTNELKRRIKENYRHPWLPATLQTADIDRIDLQVAYGIDWYSLMSDEFIYTYKGMEDGTERDLYVVKNILDTVNDPVKSLADLDLVKEKYLSKTL